MSRAPITCAVAVRDGTNIGKEVTTLSWDTDTALSIDDVWGGGADPLGPADLSDLIQSRQPILSIGDACSLSCSWCCWLSITC